MREKIYHITTEEAWAEAQLTGEYRHASLDEEGFIHTSYPEQIVRIANTYYKGRDDLLILCINRNQTNCKVVDEHANRFNAQFPHIYGTIPVSAVFKVVPFGYDEDGTFSLPSQIQG
jgi:uncharacterized protein (DUF952 family)